MLRRDFLRSLVGVAALPSVPDFLDWLGKPRKTYSLPPKDVWVGATDEFMYYDEAQFDRWVELELNKPSTHALIVMPKSVQIKLSIPQDVYDAERSTRASFERYVDGFLRQEVGSINRELDRTFDAHFPR